MTRRSRYDDLDIFDGRGHSRGGRGRRRGASALLALLGVIVVVGLVGAAGYVLYKRINPDTSVELRVLGVEGPVTGASIEGDAGTTETGDEGAAHLSVEPPTSLVVSAPGYLTGTYQVDALPETGPLYLQLEPVVLTGRVMDTGGTGIAEAQVTFGERQATTGARGSFEFVAAVPGPLAVSKMGWEPADAEWDGSSGRFDITIEPFIVRGLRINAEVAGSPAMFGDILDMIDGTVINTLVFDTKQEYGAVMYDSQVPDAVETGAVTVFYPADEVLRQADELGLYTITRIVTFQDGVWARANPEHAIRNAEAGGLWTNSANLTWIDPTDREGWEYPISLAEEACRLGFDEIQFDYVRFPTDGNVGITEYDVAVDATIRVQTIAAFLAAARDRLHAIGCAVSADIFGIVLSVPDDQGLGQRVEELSYSVDALSPMVYPSHYSSGWLGLETPNDHPSDVVGQALNAGQPKLEGTAVMRPWLQAFYYNAAQIQAEIDRAEDLAMGWILWNAASEFDASWLPPG